MLRCKTALCTALVVASAPNAYGAPAAVEIERQRGGNGRVAFVLRNTTGMPVRVSAEGTTAWYTEIEARHVDGSWRRLGTVSPTCGLSRAAMHPLTIGPGKRQQLHLYVSRLPPSRLKGLLRAVFRVEVRASTAGKARWIMQRTASRPFTLR